MRTPTIRTSCTPKRPLLIALVALVAIVGLGGAVSDTIAATGFSGVSGAPDEEFLSTPAAVDPESGKTWRAPVRQGQYAGEPVPVTKAGATRDDEVWLLSVVLDAAAGRSELWVLDGEGLEAGPIAVVPLPHVVPFGFHGNWVRAN